MRIASSFAVLMFTVVILVSGCHQQPQITSQQALEATTSAAAQLHDIDKALDGVAAEVSRQQVIQTLASVNGGLDSIGTSLAELDEKVRNAWYREAKWELTALQQPSADINRGTDLKKAFLNAQRKSGRPISAYGIENETTLDHYVARYYLVGAKKQGATLTPADYHQAGLPVVKERVIEYQYRPLHATKSSPKHSQ